MDSTLIPGRGLYTEDAREKRIEFLEGLKGVNLEILEDHKLPSESLMGHIENHIGSLSIPIGVAGPLCFARDGASENVFAPIATTEGALVASLTRGARAFTLSGGVSARVISQKMTRVPMFELRNLQEAVDFGDWASSQFSDLKKFIKRFSNFSELTEIKTRHVGRSVHLHFVFSTKDAAGQNMTTICTWKACQRILEQARLQTPFQVQNFILDGGLSTDKKASMNSVINGRGTEVIAEGIIKGDVLRDVLKVKKKDLMHLYHLSKSSRFFSGMMGWNINVSNLVAGMFTATGQDIACVHESSIAEVHLEEQGDDIYASINIPSLIVGTVGGGTRLPSQRACLELIGCFGAGYSHRLAEIIAGFALALDLSTMCAMVGGQFAEAHNRLGRTLSSLKRSDLNEFFFASSEFTLLNASEKIEKLTELPALKNQDSLVMEMGSQVTQKLCGFVPMEFQMRDIMSNETRSEKILLKIKPTDKEVILAAEMMAAMCGDHVVEAYRQARPWNLFNNNHVKELWIGNCTDLLKWSPATKGVVNNEAKQIYMLASELVEDFSMRPSSDNRWSKTDIEAGILCLRELHQVFMNQTDALPAIFKNPLFENEVTSVFENFLEILAEFAAKEFPEIFTSDSLEFHRAKIKTLKSQVALLQAGPKTLIHHDFNTRNIGFRGDRREPVILDWELSLVHSPFRDLVELISFSFDEDFSDEAITEAIHLYLGHRAPTNRDYAEMLACQHDFILHRLSLYFVAHMHKECSFLGRVYRNARRLEKHLSERVGEFAI